MNVHRESSDHVLPTPAVAGWTEEERLQKMARIRSEIAESGATIVSERRIRNVAFDGPGERTTFTFTVVYPASPRDGT